MYYTYTSFVLSLIDNILKQILKRKITMWLKIKV